MWVPNVSLNCACMKGKDAVAYSLCLGVRIDLLLMMIIFDLNDLFYLFKTTHSMI